MLEEKHFNCQCNSVQNTSWYFSGVSFQDIQGATGGMRKGTNAFLSLQLLNRSQVPFPMYNNVIVRNIAAAERKIDLLLTEMGMFRPLTIELREYLNMNRLKQRSFM
ncbi:hypothetical protein L345_06703, partial [Ophiophagus hannah]